MAKKIGARMILYLYLAVFLTRIGFGSVTILFPLYLPTGAFQVGLILALYPIAEGCFCDARWPTSRSDEQEKTSPNRYDAHHSF